MFLVYSQSANRFESRLRTFLRKPSKLALRLAVATVRQSFENLDTIRGDVVTANEGQYVLATIYTDGSYLESNATWHAEDAPWKAAKVAEMMRRNGVSYSSVAEVGCGSVEILRTLAEINGHETSTFDGFDISPQAIEIARKSQNERLRFHLRDPFSSNREEHFDLALVMDVFEHVPDYIGFLERCRRVADYRVFHIPLDLHVSSVLRGTLMAARNSVGHIHYFSAETALATLTDVGYEILDSEYTCGAIDLAKLHPSWKTSLANLPRRVVSIFSTLRRQHDCSGDTRYSCLHDSVLARLIDLAVRSTLLRR